MSEREKAEETYQLYSYDRDNGHETFLRRAEEASRYYASEQWRETDRQKRLMEERPTVTVNELFNSINAVAGEMEQLSTDVRFYALSGHQDTAIALNKLAEHTDRQNKMYIHDDRVRRDGLLLGRGFYECRMEFDKNLQGQVVIKAKRPQNVILPCDMDSPDPATWSRVSTTAILSLNDVDEMFGRHWAEEMRGMPMADWLEYEDRTLSEVLGKNNAFRSHDIDNVYNPHIKQYRMISMQYTEMKAKDFFVDLATGDMSEIPENWSREKIAYAVNNFGLGTMRRRAKTVRWRVVVNDRVVHDEDSPYKFYTIVPYFPYFNDGVTQSLFDVLQGPQDLLNKALSEEIHILALSSNSGWKIKNNSLRNMTMRQLEQKGAKNGLVLALDEVSDAERIQPGAPPAGLADLSTRAQAWTKTLGGVTPSMQGAQRADASGEGIEMSLLRAPVNLSVPLTAFHYTKHLLAERKLNLFQTFYTETRVLRITKGPYGQPELLAINAPQEGTDQLLNDLTLGEYVAHILPAGSRMQAEQYAFDELVQLKEMGVVVPNDLLVDASSINAKADYAERLREANNGEVSPEEMRARELELEQLELDVADTRASVENKQAQTQLALGRAERAYADAAIPSARIQIDRDRLVSEHTRDQQRMSLERQKQVSDTAIKLTELEVDAENAKEDRQAQKEMGKQKQATQAKKTAAKKTAKKQPHRK